jgi:hypothetical protein
MAPRTIQSLPLPKAAIGFRPEYLDFRRGIRVGNLEDHERITRILKLELEARYGEAFVTERYGRGVYWQWIGYLPRANRLAKPLSSHVSFGCAKLFVMIDTEDKLFKCGLQVERGRIEPTDRSSDYSLRSDWDWHRLVKGLKPGSALERELNRLVNREGFHIHAGTWGEPAQFSKTNWPGVQRLRKVLAAVARNEWAALQLYYPMSEDEVRGSSGVDLIEAMLAIFREVTPTMNRCMQVQIHERRAVS